MSTINPLYLTPDNVCIDTQFSILLAGNGKQSAEHSVIYASPIVEKHGEATVAIWQTTNGNPVLLATLDRGDTIVWEYGQESDEADEILKNIVLDFGFESNETFLDFLINNFRSYRGDYDLNITK